MRTGCSLTVCWSLVPGGGYLLWRVSALGGCLIPRGCLLLGGVCSWGDVCSGGVSAPGGCLFLGGVFSRGSGVCSRGSGVCSGGWGWVSAPGGVCSQGVSASRGCGIPACTEADTPPVNRITDTSKNITLATTSLRPVKITMYFLCNLFFSLICYHFPLRCTPCKIGIGWGSDWLEVTGFEIPKMFNV